MEAMLENDKLRAAINTLLQGDRDSAANQLWELEKEIVEPKNRIQLIDGLLSASNPIDGGEKLISLTQEAIKISEEFGNKILQAHFTIRYINLVSARLIFPQYERANLKLAHGWLGFSTESDKQRYEELDMEIKRLEKEISTLLDKIFIIAKEEKNNSLTAEALLTRGEITSQRYFRLKSNCTRNSFMAKMWLKFDIFRRPMLESLVTPSVENRRKLKKMLEESITDMLQGAKILEGSDNRGCAYAYYKLAVNLNTAYKFWAANKYLKRAKKMAQECNESLLLTQIKNLELIIKDKNRNIPNYLEGERR